MIFYRAEVLTVCWQAGSGGLRRCSATKRAPAADCEAFLVVLQSSTTGDQSTEGSRNTDSIFTSKPENYLRVHRTVLPKESQMYSAL